MDVVQDGFVTVRGLRFHYRDWGGDGHPVVLLHGLASSCRTWDYVAPLLRSHFRVLALDQRGHGTSDKPDDGYDYDSVTEDLQGFLSAMALERPLLVGHSWGCSVVLEYAAKRAQDLTGIVMVDGGFGGPGDHPGRSWEQMWEQLAPPDLTSYTPAQLMEWIRSRSRTPWTAERESILMAQFIVTPRGTVTPQLSRENHKRILHAMWERSGAGDPLVAQCPVLMMPCRQSGEGADQERMQRKETGVQEAGARLPVSRTVWMDDSVHDVQLQRPESVAQTIIDAVTDGFFPSRSGRAQVAT